MRVLVLGGEGMLGHKVFQVLSERFEVYATFIDSGGLWMRYPIYEGVDRSHTIAGVNAMDFDSIIRAFTQVEPDVAINCIGIVKQLKEAKDALTSIRVNSLFPHQLAELCTATGTRMFHMSTDCVFSGRKGNYTEEDPPDPEDLYGRTKLLGEVDRPGCLTIRTSIFGRDFAKQSALLEWFLGSRGKHVRGFVNAIYSGFPTQVLACIIGDLVENYPELSGLYQVASTPISKHDLLVKIRDAMELDIEIEPYADFSCDRSLDGSCFVAKTGYQIPEWDAMIAELARDDTPYDAWRDRYAIS
jgi:dTDP-4-dehydrorhamnose reductase